MASESTEERTVTVDLPTELADWLDEHANSQGVDRGTLLVQLLASYRKTTQFDGTLEEFSVESDELVGSLEDDLEDAVSNVLVDILDEHLDERMRNSVREQFGESIETEVNQAVDNVVTNQVNEATNAVQKQLESRTETVEDEFQEKIEDVRSRVIQVKKQTDKKAPADHSHSEFQTIESLNRTVQQLESDLSELQSEYEALVPEHETRLGTHKDQLEQMQDRLQTIAWVLSDLREAHQSRGGLEAVDRIKRAAAQADIERANCENCGNSVNLALLTDPNCPHCDATVSNVEPSSGWFSNPTLLTASQLESGEIDE